MRFKSTDTISFDASRVRESEQDSWVSLGSLLAVASERFNKAELCERLARKPDAELAAQSLRREEPPRFVMFGRR